MKNSTELKARLGRDEIVDLVRSGEIKIQDGALLVRLVDFGRLSTRELANRVTTCHTASSQSHVSKIGRSMDGLMRRGFVQKKVESRTAIWQLA